MLRVKVYFRKVAEFCIIKDEVKSLFSTLGCFISVEISHRYDIRMILLWSNHQEPIYVGFSKIILLIYVSFFSLFIRIIFNNDYF
jgi:hypothetical protein